MFESRNCRYLACYVEFSEAATASFPSFSSVSSFHRLLTTTVSADRLWAPMTTNLFVFVKFYELVCEHLIFFFYFKSPACHYLLLVLKNFFARTRITSARDSDIKNMNIIANTLLIFPKRLLYSFCRITGVHLAREAETFSFFF